MSRILCFQLKNFLSLVSVVGILRFCLSGDDSILPSFMKNSCDGYRILGWQLCFIEHFEYVILLFSHFLYFRWEVSCHFYWGSLVMSFCLFVCLPPAGLKMFCFLAFIILNMICLRVSLWLSYLEFVRDVLGYTG